MNAVMENLLTRRSVRAFEDREIPREELDEILKAAQYAPSAMNRQTWQFTVVCSRSKIQKLAEAIGKALNRDNYTMYEPQVIIITTNLRNARFGVDDNACALENIFLAAHSFGIGSVWINQLRDACDDPKVREMLRGFGIPDDHMAYGIAALGYAAPAPEKELVKNGKIVFVD
ncbi:MAG: nitroreductase family protein [Hungatella sp.]|nr:nitroreductase family protein [Hungatella sp.]